MSNMFFKMLSSTLLLLSALVGAALADSFNLYAYGDGIGGLPLHYADGAAVVGRNKPANASKSDVVAFTTSNGRLVGNPNATSTDPPFADTLLFIPGPESTSHEIGFVNETSAPPANEILNKFVWYGHSLFVENADGEFTSLFSVRKSASSDEEGYSLLWNTTDSDAGSGEQNIVISMRSIAPSAD
ncbi:hypothetical protein BJX64DRAFT_288544 [Aspergillus heterothallicus]